jgi:CHAT domain-containing protein/predicted negative regulator of RcsB-dependent stress response
MRKAVWILALCLRLPAQETLLDRLVGAPDDETASSLLANNPAAVTPELFEACRNAAQSRLDRRENSDALREFRAALAVAKALHSDRSAAVALRGAGIASMRMNRARQALSSYEEGLAAAERADAREAEAELLRGIGVAHRNLGEFPEAIESDERSVALYRELGDRHQIAAGLSNLGTNYRETGDLRRAGELWEEALQTGGDYKDVVATATGNLALIAGDLGNAAAQKEYIEKLNRGAEEAKDWHALATGLINVGAAYRDLGEIDKAFQGYSRALELARQTHDTRYESVGYLNRAALYVGQHKYALAIEDLEQSLRISETGDSKDAEVLALCNLAMLELKLGRVDQASEHARRAEELARRFQAPDVEWQAFDALGKTAMYRKDRQGARQSLEHSIASVELLRAHAGGGDEDGQYFLDRRISAYHDLLRLDVEEGMPEQAFYLAERAKARQLLDVARQGKTERNGPLTAEQTAQERSLSAKLAQLDGQVTTATDAKARAAAQKRLELAQGEMEAFRMRLYAAHRPLAEPRDEGLPLQLAQTAELLPDAHTALVEFTCAEDELYVFTIVRGADGKPRLRAYTIPMAREELTREVDEFVRKVGARDLGYREAAARLYTKLLGPTAAELRSSRLLVVVPDGPLWNLPFQALLGADGRYLIERQAVFYAPSLTWLSETRAAGSAARAASHELLALGDPDTAGLPEAAREVRELVRLYGPGNAKALTGAEALKTTWLKDAPNYRILHVATHGILNSRNPMYSYLTFSGKTGSDTVLEAREVVNLNLHTDLVVLSACETGRGRVSIGEGLVGMSWAFLLAGARTTVVSQWKTDSAGTTRLMLGMHEHLKPVFSSEQGFGRARSLQKAAVALMQTPEYSHPFYWAGFVMVGDGY